MIEAHVPQEHSSIVGGSTASRRIGCPASYRLEKRVPQDERGSVYAREGTTFHELMAKVVSEEMEPTSLLPFTYTAPPDKGGWSHTLTMDDWNRLGEPALAAFDKLVVEAEEYHQDSMILKVETRLAFPGIPGAFGTTDIIGLCGGDIYVIDWKFGHNPVSARENAQLQFYAASVFATDEVGDYLDGFDWDDGGEAQVHLCIIQPTVSREASVWTIGESDLDAFSAKLQAAVKAAEEGTTEPARGPWCKYARCVTVCPAHLSAPAALVGLLREQEAAAAQGVEDHIDWSERFAQLLDLAEACEALIDGIEDQALAAAETGMAIPGWSLAAKRPGPRKWKDGSEAALRRFMGRHGFKVAEYMPRSLATVAQVEKLVQEKVGLALDERFVVPGTSSGNKLVRAKDNPNPVKSHWEKIAPLAEKLASVAK